MPYKKGLIELHPAMVFVQRALTWFNRNLGQARALRLL